MKEKDVISKKSSRQSTNKKTATNEVLPPLKPVPTSQQASSPVRQSTNKKTATNEVLPPLKPVPTIFFRREKVGVVNSTFSLNIKVKTHKQSETLVSEEIQQVTQIAPEWNKKIKEVGAELYKKSINSQNNVTGVINLFTAKNPEANKSIERQKNGNQDSPWISCSLTYSYQVSKPNYTGIVFCFEVKEDEIKVKEDEIKRLDSKNPAEKEWCFKGHVGWDQCVNINIVAIARDKEFDELNPVIVIKGGIINFRNANITEKKSVRNPRKILTKELPEIVYG